MYCFQDFEKKEDIFDLMEIWKKKILLVAYWNAKTNKKYLSL